MIAPPIVAWSTPTVFESTLLTRINLHLFLRIIIPDRKSRAPMVRKTRPNKSVFFGSVKALISIKLNKIKKTIPVKTRLVTIKKPPIAILSLTSFRINPTQLVLCDSIRIDIMCRQRFNKFAIAYQGPLAKESRIEDRCAE